MYFDAALAVIDRAPQGTFDQIVGKYVEMNIAHPFWEGNATYLWTGWRGDRRDLGWTEMMASNQLELQPMTASDVVCVLTRD